MDSKPAGADPLRINVVSRFDLLTLRLFVAIVEERSIARAAERENIAASAVSKRVGDVEQALRMDLLHRNRQGVSPTPAGEALFRHAQIILRDLAELEAELIEFSAGTRGCVRVWANESTLFGFIPELLAAFRLDYPLVRVELQSSLSPLNVQAVMDNGADIGIFAGEVSTFDLQVHPWFEDDLVALAPTNHPLAARASVRLADILPYEIIEQEARSSIQTRLVLAASEAGEVLRSRIRVGGFDAVCRMVEAGLGIGIIPAQLARKFAPMMAVAMLSIDEPWSRRRHKICVRRGDRPIATRLLLERLLSAVALPSPSTPTG